MKPWILALIGALSIAGAAAGQSSHKTTGTAMMPGHEMQMRESDKKLDDLVQQLNAAHGNDRVDRLVAVVNQLVAERRQMREMMAMHEGMMGHMASKPAEAVTPEEDHSAHHPEKK
jgi:hypothetical protein